MDEQKECPKSIWDEFPFERWDQQPLRLKGYIQAAMPPIFSEPLETWLEKLKEEWEAMENQITLSNITIEGLDKEYLILREEADRLEAIKNWIMKQPQYGEGGLEELEKILEAEE